MREGGDNLRDNSLLLEQFIEKLNSPNAKEVIIKYLTENYSSELVEITEEIFSNPNKRDEFLKSTYRKKYLEISEKTPKHDKSAIIKMEQLINNKYAKEQDMKKFFIKHPWFIGFEYTEIETQKKLGEKRIPDYMLKHVNGNYDIIEIKGPNDHIFNQNKGNNQFNQYFINGLLQLMGYIDFCDKHYDYMKSEHNKNIYKPKGILLIDNNLNQKDREVLSMFTSFLDRISIKTYDEVYDAAKNALKHT